MPSAPAEWRTSPTGTTSTSAATTSTSTSIVVMVVVMTIGRIAASMADATPSDQRGGIARQQRLGIPPILPQEYRHTGRGMSSISLILSIMCSMQYCTDWLGTVRMPDVLTRQVSFQVAI